MRVNMLNVRGKGFGTVGSLQKGELRGVSFAEVVSLQALDCFALYAQQCNLILIHFPPLIRVLFQKAFYFPGEECTAAESVSGII